MIDVSVLFDAYTRVGTYPFVAVPCEGETLHIPWSDDPDGVRIFEVEDVWLYAPGTPKPEGEAAVAVLVREIT